MLIGWKTASLSLHVASVRYRALLPSLHLQERQIQSRIFSTGTLSNLNDLDALVIVKSYGAEDLHLACAARDRGIPVIIDLCDNIFIDGYGKKHGVALNNPALCFDKIAAIASTVVVTTSPLAEIVRTRVDARCSVVVIPDGIESPTDVARMEALLSAARRAQQQGTAERARRRLATLRRRVSLLRSAEVPTLLMHMVRSTVSSLPVRLRRLLRNKAARVLIRSAKTSPPQPAHPLPDPAIGTDKQRPRSIVWFGHHGADYARFGMLDLLEIRSALETTASSFDVELVVISNSEAKFKQHIQQFAMRTRYVEWSSTSLRSELSQAAVVVIPNSLDAFSLCKSTNRAVLSLLHGVPVVATRTPALDSLQDCVILNDFAGGLATYLGDASRAVSDIKRSRQTIDLLYGPQAIGDQWHRVLHQARPCPIRTPTAPSFAVVLQAPLDLSLLQSVIHLVTGRGESVLAILNAEQSQSMATMSVKLMEAGVAVIWLSPQEAERFTFPPTIRSLLSASESSLYPHRLAHTLTRKANAAGIATATIQHGYEAPGLTYHDSLHSARKIGFASQRIYLWGPLSTLCAEVPATTAERCKVVGCPDSHFQKGPTMASDIRQGPLKVGIFENLHWHRYSATYRQSFIKGVMAVTSRFPKVEFTLQTHPAGRWLDSNEAAPLSRIQNLRLVTPEMQQLADDVPDHLFHGASAVISTPSSVVVHAAHRGLVVGVVAGDLTGPIDRYQPLQHISGPEDWLTFVEQIQNDSQLPNLQTRSQTFIDSVICPGDAALRIANDLCTQIER